MVADGAILSRAVSDADDRLVLADELLASLQLRCGGELPGTIAIPSLLEVVRKVRRYQLKLARQVSGQDHEEAFGAWVEVEPRSDGEIGCEIFLRSIRRSALPEEASDRAEERRIAIDRHLAELTARLDGRQRLLAVESDAADLAELRETMLDGIGELWTNFVTFNANSHHQPLHWRLLDGAQVTVAGSARSWRATLIPTPAPGSEPSGFELLLVSDEPLQSGPVQLVHDLAPVPPALIGEDIAPVLRQPIERIKANAETIRTRLAGPLSQDYANYASEISAAAEHLLGLLDDLSDLEVVEAQGFLTASDHIDLADVARQAAGIQSVRAQEKQISIDVPKPGDSLPAIAEFRRVLQILLNLLGNAINYSPEGSSIWIRIEEVEDRSRIIVADQGPGLSPEATRVIFEKFERLGRSGDGGSGLGLYISRKLARAMGGELSVDSAPGQGARFLLELPGDGDKSAL
ncbi:MAG: sensor histidine kinase [Novosphingobium sp.]|nr:sensor histidine kinase [Novosphingobium sp.]